MRQAVELAQGDSATPVAHLGNGTVVHHPVGCNHLLIGKSEHRCSAVAITPPEVDTRTLRHRCVLP